MWKFVIDGGSNKDSNCKSSSNEVFPFIYEKNNFPWNLLLKLEFRGIL